MFQWVCHWMFLVYRVNSLKIPHGKRITQDDPYYQKISKQWSETLRRGLHEIPKPSEDYLL